MSLGASKELWDGADMYLRELREMGVTYFELHCLIAKICDEIPLEEEKR